MSCVVGIADGTVTILGADAAISYGDSVCTTDDPPKVWVIGGWAIGVCGDLGALCALRNLTGGWKTESEAQLAIRACALKRAARGADWYALFGRRGRLWYVEPSGAWHRVQERRGGRRLVGGALAIGSGAQEANGSLRSTGRRGVPAAERVIEALEVAEYFRGDVRAPFRCVEA